VTIDVTETARTWLAEKGYDETMGARPMARVIDDLIKKPLAEQILFGELEQGGTLAIDIKDDQLKLAFDSKKAENKKSKTESALSE